MSVHQSLQLPMPLRPYPTFFRLSTEELNQAIDDLIRVVQSQPIKPTTMPVVIEERDSEPIDAVAAAGAAINLSRVS